MPCSGNATETETCCVTPTLSITFEECYEACATSLPGQHAFQAEGVFTDDVPETTYDHWWMGDPGPTPQKFRIGFSCPKMISSVSMRNSGMGSDPTYMGPDRYYTVK